MTTRAEQDAKALAARTKAARKRKRGHDIAFFFEECITVVLVILALWLAARAFGWDQTTTDINLINMINDDSAGVRGVVMLAIFVVLLLAVGKPATMPKWLIGWRLVGVIVGAGFIFVFYWFGWGGGMLP
jgi:nitroreductase